MSNDELRTAASTRRAACEGGLLVRLVAGKSSTREGTKKTKGEKAKAKVRVPSLYSLFLSPVSCCLCLAHATAIHPIYVDHPARDMALEPELSTQP